MRKNKKVECPNIANSTLPKNTLDKSIISVFYYNINNSMMQIVKKFNLKGTQIN